MNKIHSKVWSKPLGQLVVASELASRAGNGGGKAKATVLTAAALLISLSFAGAVWAADPVVGATQGIFVNDGTDPGCSEYLDYRQTGTAYQPQVGLYNSICSSTDKGTQTNRVLFYSNGYQGGGSTSLTLGGELFVNSGQLGLADQSGGTYSMRLGSAATMGYLNNSNGANGTYGSNGITPGVDSIAIGSAQTSATDFGTPTKATGNAATAIGSAASAVGNNSIALGTTASTSAANDGIAVGNAASAKAAKGIALGSGSTATNANDVALGAGSSTGNISSGPYTILAGGAAAAGVPKQASGVVSVGSVGNERQIQNVAAGTLSASSTDAVNGSQLYAADTAITAVGTTVTNLGNSTAASLGGGSTYDPATGQLTTSLTVGGNTYNNVNSALQAIGGAASAGWNVTTSATGTGVVNGSSVANVAPGSTVTITAGNNIITTQNGTDVAIGVNPVLTGLTSVTAGNTTVNTNGVTVNDGTSSTAYSSTGMTIANGPSVTTTGVNAGGQQITNVAAGTASNDAATVGQVQAAQAGSVKYDTNADGSINYESITLNPGGSAAQVHNVAPGTASTDAANVGQVQQGMQAVQDWSKSYTDQAVNNLGNKAFAGVASAIATASLPQAYQPNQSSAGVGLGNFHGESAISVGLSTISESGRWIFKANVSSDTRGDAGVGVGAGIVW